jgi:hypothetical protein
MLKKIDKIVDKNLQKKNEIEKIINYSRSQLEKFKKIVGYKIILITYNINNKGATHTFDLNKYTDEDSIE